MNILASSDSPGPDGVVRRLGDMEKMIRVCHKYGNTQIVYALMIKSKDVLDSSVVCDALIHLRRKLPMLRMRLVEDDENVYFKEMEEEEIDFEMCEQDEWKTDYEDMLCAHYDEVEGPLWQVKLLKMSTNPSEADGSAAPDVAIDKNEKPHKYVMLFGFHHVITDGFSNLKVFSKFLEILNSLIAGEEISDTQEAEVMSAVEDMVPEEERKFRITDVLSTVKLFGKHIIFQKKNLYLAEYPALRGAGAGRTRTLPFQLTQDETTKFVQRCKQGSATVHGAFTVAANKAIYELIHRDKIERPVATIRSAHDVSLHRFCQPWRDMNTAFGLYVSSFDVDMECHSIDMNRFWKTAEQATQLIHDELTAQKILQTKRIIEKVVEPEKYLKDMGKTNKSDTEFATSNLGDVSKLFDGAGEHVEVDKFVRSTSCHLLGAPFIHRFATFRGRFLYNIDYCTNFVTEEQAREYAELILYNIRKATDQLESSDDHAKRPVTPAVKITPPDVVIDVEQTAPLLNNDNEAAQ